MSLLAFPDWVPWWLQLLAVVGASLFALAFLFMPFSVFGVKSRLEMVEARLDDIQQEIRALALRLPEPGRGIAVEEESLPPPPRAAEPVREVPPRPPIPPAPWQADEGWREGLAPRPTAPPASGPSRERAEPRLGR